MGRNSVVTQPGSTYKITQGTAEFSDYRRWYLNSSGKALAIADSLQIARVGADGIVEDTSPPLSTNDTIKITMAINRNETEAKVIYRKTTESDVKLTTLNISTMQFTGEVSLGNTTPLRAIISADEKIVWLGDNKTLYVMNLDGSNLESITPNAQNSSFALSDTGNIFISGFNYNMYKFTYNTIDNTLSQEQKYDVLPDVDIFSEGLDGFILNNYWYVLQSTRYTQAASNVSIIKIPLATWNDKSTYLIKDVTADYSVIQSTAGQFNASGADNFATFSCTIGIRQTVMQCNLDTLECMPARRVNYAEREIEYSNDAGKEIEKLGIDITKANNCDWKGLLTSSKGATGSI